MNKTIIITGANGFLGKTLCNHFCNIGYDVRAFVRQKPSAEISERIKYFDYDLTKPLREDYFNGADYLIHCAYIPYNPHTAANSNELNIKGAEQLINYSRRAGIKKNIFISSMSAQTNATSNYGKQKFAIEKIFNTHRDVVVRPGLILGNGGLLKKMISFIKKKHMVPLIDGGQQPLQTICVHELVVVIEKIIEKDLDGIYTLAENDPVSYIGFYKTLCEIKKIKAIFVPVPYSLMNFLIRLLGFLGFMKGISNENLLGLKNMKKVETINDQEKIGVTLSDYKSTLSRLALKS